MNTQSYRQKFVAGALTAVPICAFVLLNALTTLRTALVGTVVIAVSVLALQMIRRQPLLHAIIGCAIAVLGGVIAAVTGEARGFFLLSTIVPVVIALICLVSVAMRRPLAGLLLNNLAGGATGWHRMVRLRRIYNLATLACAAVNILTAFLQIVFYTHNWTVLLAAVHIGTGPIFAVIVGITIAIARHHTNRISNI